MSTKMTVYYRAPEDPDSFEKRYLEGHLPLIRDYDKVQHVSFHKVSRVVMGEFPYAYVFTGTWADWDGLKADLNSPKAKAAGDDAKSFAPPFDVVIWEQLD